LHFSDAGRRCLDELPDRAYDTRQRLFGEAIIKAKLFYFLMVPVCLAAILSALSGCASVSTSATANDVSQIENNYKQLNIYPPVVLTENTEASLNTLAVYQNILRTYNMGMGSDDVDPQILMDGLRSSLLKRFEQSGSEAQGNLVLVFDAQLQLGQHSFATTSLQLSGTFMDGKQIIQTVTGEGSHMVPYPAFNSGFRNAAQQAFAQFDANLQNAPALAAYLSSNHASNTLSASNFPNTPNMLNTPATPQYWIGVAVQKIPPVYSHLLGLNPDQGLMVLEVVPQSPAAKAGLAAGDLLVRINDQALTGLQQLLQTVNQGGNAPCAMTYISEGRHYSIHVYPENRPANVSMALPPAQQLIPGSTASSAMPPPGTVNGNAPPHWIGVKVQKIPPVYSQLLGLNPDQGLLVLEVVPQSPAAKAGIAAGDLLVQVNNQPVTDPEQLIQAVNLNENGKIVPCELTYISEGRSHSRNIVPENSAMASAASQPPTSGSSASTAMPAENVDFNALVKPAIKGDAAALAQIKVAANSGDAAAQDALGAYYYANKRFDEAFDWVQKSAQQGYPKGQNDLGHLYAYGLGTKQDYVQAFIWIQKDAAQGDKNGEYELGLFYAHGYGTQQDYAAALNWYQKAAEQGDPRAQNDLGHLYAYGRGTKQDYTQALYWFAKDAAQGDAKGEYDLGLFYAHGLGTKQDYAQAFTFFQGAATQGYVVAQNSLGYLYEHGLGTAQDYTAALNWYQKAAEWGYADAQNNLGYLYEHGLGTARDYTAALNWFAKAAAQGDKNGEFNLGVFYAHGYGTKQDFTQAFIWYQKAATQGDAGAQDILGSFYELGLGTKQDYAQAFIWYQKAATQGDMDAQDSLGTLYENLGALNENATGKQQDYTAALYWFGKAAAQGDADACQSLSNMYKRGLGVTADEQKAAYWDEQAKKLRG
jgi:TPR repeat protein/S1-C subfamily serine protease